MNNEMRDDLIKVINSACNRKWRKKMINQEINEYLAEHLFGLKCNFDALGWCIKYDCDNYGVCERKCIDYISNYQPVLEKLIELGWSITRLSQVVDNGILIKNQYICEINHSYLTSYQYRGYGETIGEAVCKAAVEYLKAREELKCQRTFN